MGNACSCGNANSVKVAPEPPAGDAVPLKGGDKAQAGAWTADADAQKHAEGISKPAPDAAPAEVVVVQSAVSRSQSKVVSTAYGGSTRKVTILHFNDVRRGLCGLACLADMRFGANSRGGHSVATGLQHRGAGS
jgi:hypothetical protein